MNIMALYSYIYKGGMKKNFGIFDNNFEKFWIFYSQFVDKDVDNIRFYCLIQLFVLFINYSNLTSTHKSCLNGFCCSKINGWKD